MVEINNINEVPLGQVVFDVSVQVRAVESFMTEKGRVTELSERRIPFYEWSKAVVKKIEEDEREVIVISSTNGDKIVETLPEGIVSFSCFVPDSRGKKNTQDLLTI